MVGYHAGAISGSVEGIRCIGSISIAHRPGVAGTGRRHWEGGLVFGGGSVFKMDVGALAFLRGKMRTPETAGIGMVEVAAITTCAGRRAIHTGRAVIAEDRIYLTAHTCADSAGIVHKEIACIALRVVGYHTGTVADHTKCVRCIAGIGIGYGGRATRTDKGKHGGG